MLTRTQVIVGSKIRLRPKHLTDSVNDYAWCSDVELCRLDASTPTAISFEKFMTNYAHELLHASQSHRFAIETLLDETHIGNCAYFNIDNIKNDVETGIMIGNRAYWNQGYGADATTTLLYHIFSQTNIERIYLKTLDWNIRAQKCFEKCGFTPCGQLIHGHHKFIIMEIRPSSLPPHQAQDNK